MKLARPVVCFSLSVLMLGLIGGCASTPAPEQASAQPAQSASAPKAPSVGAGKAIDEARAAVKQAASVNGLWRDTEDLIKQADAALAQGNEETAVKLANKAKKQAELGYQQAISERDNWRKTAASVVQ